MKLVFLGKIKQRNIKSVSPHSHSCYEVVLYESAKGETEINNEKYPIKSGAVAIISGGSLHDEHHLIQHNLMYFGFENHNSFDLINGVYYPDNFKELQNIALEITKEVKGANIKHEIMTEALLKRFFVLFERGLTDKGEINKNFNYIINHLRENFSQRIDLPDLVKDYGYDYDRFRREFKQKYKTSPKQYIVNERLQSARQMLAATELNCTEIAMQCGFSDSSQFSKMFKSKFGESPENYRKNAK